MQRVIVPRHPESSRPHDSLSLDRELGLLASRALVWVLWATDVDERGDLRRLLGRWSWIWVWLPHERRGWSVRATPRSQLLHEQAGRRNGRR